MSAIDTILAALQNVLPSFARSDGSIEAKIIDVVGTYADSEAIERQNTLNVINSALASQKVTTKEYYRRKAVAFQIGDTLTYDPVNQGGYYSQINPQNQIIKQAYIVGSYPDFTLLVNAVGSNGHLRPLTGDELASFKTYFVAFQPLGMEINITSLQVAQITDSAITIYVQAGTDAGDAVTKIQANLLAYETVLRPTNAVSLTEIADIIQQYSEVRAVGFNNIIAEETLLDGTTRQVRPEAGIFNLTNGAFTFATQLSVANIKVIQ